MFCCNIAHGYVYIFCSHTYTHILCCIANGCTDLSVKVSVCMQGDSDMAALLAVLGCAYCIPCQHVFAIDSSPVL